MNPRNQAGLTLVEFIVIIGIILILAFLPLCNIDHSAKGRMTMMQSSSNMRQLHLVAQQMAIDGFRAGDTNLGWPGDLGGSFTNWTTQLLKCGYLTTNDLCKLLSARGLIVPPGKVPAMNDTAVRIYAVCKDSPVDAVLFTSANFTNTPTGGEALSPSAKPYGNEGFVVCRKGGYGSIGLYGSVYLPRQVGQTNIIGSFVPLCR